MPRNDSQLASRLALRCTQNWRTERRRNRERATPRQGLAGADGHASARDHHVTLPHPYSGPRLHRLYPYSVPSATGTISSRGRTPSDSHPPTSAESTSFLQDALSQPYQSIAYLLYSRPTSAESSRLPAPIITPRSICSAGLSGDTVSRKNFPRSFVRSSTMSPAATTSGNNGGSARALAVACSAKARPGTERVKRLGRGSAGLSA